MKILRYYIMAIMLVLLCSCGTDEELPFVEFDGLGYGAVPRLIDGVNGDLDFFNIDGSTIDFTVEFYDENQGQNVQSYEVAVSYSGNPDNQSVVKSYTSSDFSTNSNGLPEVTVQVTFNEMLSALGLGADQIDGGEFMELQMTLTKTDGQVFTSGNTGSNLVSSAAFNAFLQYRANIICPSNLGGTLNYSTVGWCGTTWEGSIELVDNGSGSYSTDDFTFGAYFACYGEGATLPGGSVMLVDACNKISFSGVDRWGETYGLNSMTVEGPTLILDWFNTYAPEAGVSTLTRQDGQDWPLLTF